MSAFVVADKRFYLTGDIKICVATERIVQADVTIELNSPEVRPYRWLGATPSDAELMTAERPAANDAVQWHFESTKMRYYVNRTRL